MPGRRTGQRERSGHPIFDEQMTSDTDSTPRRRPPTIDLTATEVEAEKPAASEKAGEKPPTEPSDDGAAAKESGGGRNWTLGDWVARVRSSTTAAYAIGASAGVLTMLVVFAVLWMAGVLPARKAAPATAVSPPDTTSAQIASRLDKIETAPSGQRSDAALAAHVAAAEAEAKALSDSLAALNRRVDEIALAARDALGRANAAMAAADELKSATQQPGARRGDLDALPNRIAALEQTVKILSENIARRPATIDDHAARTTLAAEALRAAVDRGAPFATELGALKSLGTAESALAPLEPFAADGVPSSSALAHELTALTPALLRASGAAATDGSFLERLQAHAQRLVRITPIDAPQGDDPEAVVARINAAAARVDLSAAIAEIALLPGSARPLAEPWTRKAEAREKALAASRRVAADALATLNAPASR
jgi:hypothetical protein